MPGQPTPTSDWRCRQSSADKKAAAADPATCHRAISGKSSPLEAPASQGGELRCETFSAKVKALRRACCQGAARRLKLRTRCARTQETPRQDAMKLMNGRRPVHPGEVLRENFLRPARLSASALAKALRLPATRINQILRERRGISADTAMRL